MSKTSVIYKDIAPGADEDAAVTTSGAQPFTDPALLPFGSEDSFVITGELNAWGMNGVFEVLENKRFSFWSEQQSNEECSFDDYPVIAIDFDSQYSSPGITVVFNTATEEYCPAINIKWYQNEDLNDEASFYPDSVTYFCERQVLSYDRVVITLLKTNLPGRYAKVSQIRFGVYRSFGMPDLRSVSIVNESNLISAELPISTSKWTLDRGDNVEYLFQLKQPVEMYNDWNLICVHYIESSSRTSARVYDIQCHDAIGVLDESTFQGGVYANKSALELLTEIVGEDFAVDCSVEDKLLSGVLVADTRRSALQQVLFAWGACASTDGTSGIRVFSPSNNSVEIGEDRTFVGASVDTASIVTAVRIYAHSYQENANGSIEVNGVKYSDTTSVYTVENPNVTATDKQNIVEVKNATLVSVEIAQSVAQRVYDYYSRRNTNKSRFVWRGERLGDRVTQPNSWGSTNTGNIERLEIKLSNTVVANSEARGV